MDISLARKKEASLAAARTALNGQRIDVQCRKCRSSFEVPPGPWLDRNGNEHPGGLYFKREALNYANRSLGVPPADSHFGRIQRESGAIVTSHAGGRTREVWEKSSPARTLLADEHSGRRRWDFKCPNKSCRSKPNVLEGDFVWLVVNAIAEQGTEVVVVKV